MTFDTNLTINLGLCLALIAIVLWYYRMRTGASERIADRVRSLHSLKINVSQDAERDDDILSHRALRFIARVGEKLPILDSKQRGALSKALIRAGFRNRRATALLVAAKFFSGLAIGVVAFIFADDIPTFGQFFVARIFAFAVAFIVGMIVPEYVLAYISRQRRTQISSFLPDALDLLVICTNAGNSLNVGIRRVAAETALMSPALADELTFTANELQLGGESTTALRNFADRVNLPSARSLVSTLVQSQQYGTPITQALRVLSRTERAAHLMAMEEKAAKLPPKMTLPMMLFILPTVVLIAAGPAILTLSSVFGKMHP
jgi:tight adherence protein C